MLRIKRCDAIAGVALLSLSAAASATPMHFTESMSGDLTQIPSSSLVLGVGTNTISGTTHFGVNMPGHIHFDSDFDGFAFDLPAGMQLVAMSLAFATTSYNAIEADSDLRLCTGVGDCGPGLIDLIGTPQNVDYFGVAPTPVTFSLGFPLTPGSYSILAASLGIAALDASNPQESWSSDYTWSFSVAAIAEPSVLSLLSIGLIGLFATRRRWNL